MQTQPAKSAIMSDKDKDKEHDIPVKVVDRRRWANTEASDVSTDGATTSLKPTYVEELELKVAEKDKQIQEYLTKYRQASGEFEEMRLRLRKEISKDVERTRREILSELLEVVDNLERALEAARRSPSADALLEGVEMVRRQFLSKLEGLGVKPIDSTDARFDPTLHEAITTVPAASPDEDGMVVGVIRRGYRIGDDVLRPAAVAVAKTP
jgi:molecular chaperone GrpE